ncbi:fusl, partial [Drosophila busckii]
NKNLVTVFNPRAFHAYVLTLYNRDKRQQHIDKSWSGFTTIALLFLLGTRTLRNLGAAPYTVTMDHKSDYFEVDTMFKISGFNQPGLYVLDTLFSVFVIGSLVVIAWRGVWGIFDLTLFPRDKAKSSWGSLLIGYLTVFVTIIIQPLMRYVCRRISGFFKLIICDIYYLMIFFGAVNAWRGIWNLLDVYLYPDDRILSFWITHIIPFLLLAALKCSNSILVRGVFIDAEGTGAECVLLPMNYVRLHFLRERRKKFDSDQSQHSDISHFYLKADHATIVKLSEKDNEAHHTLIEKPHTTNVQII